MDYWPVDLYDAKQMAGLNSVRLFGKPSIRIAFPRYPPQL
jgi:hypothetical protein